MRIRNIRLVAWIVWLDFARRKDFFVIACLIGLFGLAALGAHAIGIEGDSAARLLQSVGLGLATTLAAILTGVFAARSLSEEYENRTLYPLLAKPIGRKEALVGKFAGVFSMGAASLIVFTGLAWLPSPKPAGQDTLLLAEAMLLQAVALAALAWMALWLSVAMPGLLAGFSALGLFFLGGPILGILVRFADSLPGPAAPIARGILHVIPNFGALQFTQRYVDGGGAIGPGALLALGLYGLLFALAFWALACFSFERKSL